MLGPNRGTNIFPPTEKTPRFYLLCFLTFFSTVTLAASRGCLSCLRVLFCFVVTADQHTAFNGNFLLSFFEVCEMVAWRDGLQTSTSCSCSVWVCCVWPSCIVFSGLARRRDQTQGRGAVEWMMTSIKEGIGEGDGSRAARRRAKASTLPHLVDESVIGCSSNTSRRRCNRMRPNLPNTFGYCDIPTPRGRRLPCTARQRRHRADAGGTRRQARAESWAKNRTVRWPVLSKATIRGTTEVGWIHLIWKHLLARTYFSFIYLQISVGGSR